MHTVGVVVLVTETTISSVESCHMRFRCRRLWRPYAILMRRRPREPGIGMSSSAPSISFWSSPSPPRQSSHWPGQSKKSGIVWCGKVGFNAPLVDLDSQEWYDVVWYGMVWYGIVGFNVPLTDLDNQEKSGKDVCWLSEATTNITWVAGLHMFNNW